MNSGKKTAAIASAIFLMALLYYAWLLFYFFPHQQLGKYIDAARLYSEGKLPAERLLDFSPLYFYLHLLVPHSVALYWIHIIAIAASGAIFFLLLSRFYRLPFAIAGAVLFLTDRSINVYAQAFEPEALLILFSIAFVYFFYRNKPATDPAAGLAFGLCLLCRPVFAPVAIAVPWLFKLRGRKDWKRASLLFAMPVLICLAFVWTRNALLLHRFSPSIMNPGTVFFEGNNPNSRGQSSIYPPLVNVVSKELQRAPDPQHEMYRIVARRITGKNLSVAQVNAYWSSKAAAYLRDHPARAFYLLRLKFFHVFHQYLWHDLANARNNEIRLNQAGIPAFPFAWISAMALIGMALLRDRWRDLLIFYLLFFCLLTVMLIFYVSARQHASIVFLFLFFTCATLQWLFESERRAIILTLIAITALGFLFFLKTDLMREEDHLWNGSDRSAGLSRQAYELREVGNLKEASRAAAASAAAAPWYWEIRRPAGLPFGPNGFASEAAALVPEIDLPEKFDKGYLLLQSGQTAPAQSIFASLIDDHFQPKRDFYQSSELYYYLSQTQLPGNLQKAVALLENALERTPGDPWVLAELTALTGKTNYRDMLFRYFDDLDAHWYLARAALTLKSKSTEAVDSALYVTQKLPEYRNGWIYLAAALSQAERWGDAANAYRRAIGMRPDPVMEEEAILAIFKNIAEQKKDDAFTLYSYGFVLRQFGHFSEALRMQKKALELDPHNNRIHGEIRSLEVRP